MRRGFAALVLTICLAFSISPQSVKDNRITRVDLTRLLQKWQSRLGLDAWKVDVQLVFPKSLGTEINGDEVVADVSYDEKALTATIHVDQAPAAEVEASLVHELVHLKLDAWYPPVEPCQEEETVEAIAQALLVSQKTK